MSTPDPTRSRVPDPEPEEDTPSRSRGARTRFLAEAGVAIALATVLSMVTVFRMPLGGSVTPASMLPLWLLARRHGVRAGALAGLAHGGVQILAGGKVMHPLQGALDYLLAYASQGLAGWRGPGGRLGAVALAASARMACHVAAAFVWFRDVPAGWSVLGYALAYNAGFLVPDTVVALAGLEVLVGGHPELDRPPTPQG